MLKHFPIFFILFSALAATAQVEPVSLGGWRCYMPYNGPTAVADGGEKIYAANSSAVFSLDKSDFSYDRLSKANGLSDAGIRGIYYGKSVNTLVVAYINSNIDFITDGVTTNFNAIKGSSVSGDKNIYDAAFIGDTAILSCGFGIVIYDIAEKESPATYFFTSGGSSIRVNGADVYNHAIYAATENGVYKGDVSIANLEDFSKWELSEGLPGMEVSQVITAGNLYASIGDSIFVYDGSSWDVFLYDAGWHTVHMNRGDDDKLIITQHYGDTIPVDSSRIIIVNSDGTSSVIESSTAMVLPYQAVQDDAGITWIADGYSALIRTDGINYSYYTPNGPGSSKVTDIDIFNGRLYVAPGEINASWNYLYNRDGFFTMDYGNWTNVSPFQFPLLDTVLDIITTAVNPLNEKAYFGSFGGGLLEYDPAANTLVLYKQNSSLQEVPGDPSVTGGYRVGGLAFDINGNLWVANFAAPLPLSVFTAAGEWKSFDCHIPAINGNQVGQVIVDDFDQKWVQLPRGGGVLVYNHGASITDAADDETRIMVGGEGSGNLSSNIVYCLAKDKDGEIWVGTDKGVSIFYNPGEAFSGTTAGDAAWPLVNLGGYNEYLLSGESVNSIAVDGANRKWVGTNSGVFLISADGTQQLAYFNQDNSPLLSNIITTVAIDGSTGDVYFGTDRGLVSYRFTATTGLTEHTDVKVFPNPVRPEYHGLIAISGLVDEAKVKITDTSGRLIYETTALGGQAIWDGNGYNGKRAGTGVYLVYSMNDDGSETYVTKFLVVN